MYFISRWFTVVAVFILLGLFASGAAYGGWVEGYCYLEGETNHPGTKVDFIPYPLGEVFCYTTSTISSGYYSKSGMKGGDYDVIFSHPGYITDGFSKVHVPWIGGITLPPVTLHPVSCEDLDWQEYPYEPPGTSIWFPEDEGKHIPATTYPKEWWYVNFHLTGDSTGREYGAFVAIFKIKIPPLPVVFMRLFSISDLYQQQTYTHADLPGFLTASTSELDLRYTDQIGDPDIWRNMNYVAADLVCDGNLMPFTYRLAVDATAREDGNPMNLDIIMSSSKAPMMVGGDGLVEIGDGWSYYYSHTKVKVLNESEITVHGVTEKISGYAWIDHQWGNFGLTEQITWEWLSIKLDDLREIMVADVWVNGQHLESYSGGFNLFNDDCSLELSEEYTITSLDDWTDPVSDSTFITQWRIEEVSRDIDLIVTADYNNQMMQVELLEVFPLGCFWEGVCSVTGTIEGMPVSGKAYAELTHSRTHVPPQITIISPNGGEYWYVGSEHNITWSSQNYAGKVKIEYSTNGEDWTTIVDSTVDDGTHPWTIPDSSATTCLVRISDPADGIPADTSDSFFTIYKFLPDRDGWGFSNFAFPPDPEYANMWPEECWVDYTQYPYPYRWRFFADSSDFPSWPLFVLGFGENQCYFDPPPGLVIFRPSAVWYWRAIKGDWRGSCFGFAISSYLFFDEYLSLDSLFPGYSRLYDVPLTSDSRELVNKYHVHMFGYDHLLHQGISLITKTPSQTLQECEDMFNSDVRNHQALCMWKNNRKSIHFDNPYRIETDPESSYVEYIYVYENCYPGEDTFRVKVNTSDNTWSYIWQGWDGDRGLYLMEPVSDYTTPPKLLPSSEYIEIFVSPFADVLLESSYGSIGMVGDSSFSTLPEGIPIIPGGQEPSEARPMGYFLPNATWACQFSNIQDTLFHFCVFTTDSTVISYTRSEVDSTQHEEIDYFGDDRTVMISNPDNDTHAYSLEVISVAADSEIVCSIQDISIDQGDSACYSITPESGLQVDNYGGEKTYDLRVEMASINGDAIFCHVGIITTENTSHRIIPDWRQNQDTLIILVDSGMVGSFSDTIWVDNQAGLMRGDCNGDGVTDLGDVVYLINYLFRGGLTPDPLEAGDVNCDEVIDLGDVVYLINYLFRGGLPPCCYCE